MIEAQFPNQVWNGLTIDRKFVSIKRWVDQNDWEQLVAEIKALQIYLLLHY